MQRCAAKTWLALQRVCRQGCVHAKRVARRITVWCSSAGTEPRVITISTLLTWGMTLATSWKRLETEVAACEFAGRRKCIHACYGGFSLRRNFCRFCHGKTIPGFLNYRGEEARTVDVDGGITRIGFAKTSLTRHIQATTSTEHRLRLQTPI